MSDPKKNTATHLDPIDREELTKAVQASAQTQAVASGAKAVADAAVAAYQNLALAEVNARNNLAAVGNNLLLRYAAGADGRVDHATGLVTRAVDPAAASRAHETPRGTPCLNLAAEPEAPAT